MHFRGQLNCVLSGSTPASFKKIAEYFPESSDGLQLSKETSSHERLNYDKAVIDRFCGDFDRLIQHRKGLQGLAKAKRFRRWWHDNRETYLTRPVVESYKKAGLSLDDLLDDLHLHFVEACTNSKRTARFTKHFRKVLHNPIVIALTFPLERKSKK